MISKKEDARPIKKVNIRIFGSSDNETFNKESWKDFGDIGDFSYFGDFKDIGDFR